MTRIMQSTTTSNPRILIVDDESSVRNLLCSILSDRYECFTAESAEKALSDLKGDSFDLVISDINMGGMSGIELLSAVVASSPDTVVMMNSGNQDIDSPIDAIRGGAFDYIKKPFDIEQVEIAVDRAIAHGALLVSKRQHEDHLERLVDERTAKLNYLAYHDPLTGLSNRFYFEDRLSQIMSGRAPTDHTAVVLVSLDRFKETRNTLGHTLGDRLLKEVGKRLETEMHNRATVARFEGDEFALLLGHTSAEELTRIADELFQAFKPAFTVGEYEICVSISVGISLSPGDGGDGQTLLRNADAALAHARKQGGNNYQFYTSHLNEKAIRRLALENDLRRALDRGELELHYQPKIDTNTRTIVGSEALVRWNHPELGLVPPFDFIPLAEETGLIVPVGEWILESACRQTKAWRDKGFDLNVAVNLSPCQFQQKDLVEKVVEIVRATGFDPAYLNLEVTESSIMNNAESATGVLGELRRTGIEISIDDFGTGYSSLGYLKHLPVDVLKIDKSFLDDVTTDRDAAALVQTVITLAHTLRLKVIAEGVETEEQLKFLHSLGCDEWQGYLFSKPLTAEAFDRLLTQ